MKITGSTTIEPAYPGRNEYFLVSRAGTRHIGPEKKISVGIGLVRVFNPREVFNTPLGTPTFQDVTENVGAVAAIERIREVTVGAETIKVPTVANQSGTKRFNLFLKLVTTPVFTSGADNSYLKLGVGIEDNLHPDYNFYTVLGMGPPEVQVALFKKKYSFPNTLGDTTGVNNDPGLSNYVLQEEFPENVPDGNTEKARNIDTLEIDESSNIVAESITHIWIASVSLSEDGVIGVSQKHLGALTWNSPILFYGDWTWRDRTVY